MKSTDEKAQIFIKNFPTNKNFSELKSLVSSDEQEWNRVSAKVYDLALKTAEKKRKDDMKKKNVITTSNNNIFEIIEVNSKLSDLALALPPIATMSDFRYIKSLLAENSHNEEQIIVEIGKIILNCRFRAMQKKGRFEHQEPFKEFVSLIEASTICFYRKNYISSFMTLVPVIEGVILRWIGYNGNGDKPVFDEIKKFFSKSYQRQPYPSNIQFHNVFRLACDKIIKEHFYKNSQNGRAYANFNRHLASHLLFDVSFAGHNNCIRLFLLLDLLSEIYLYENNTQDDRFYLSSDDIKNELKNYNRLVIASSTIDTVENNLLNNN